MNLTDPSGSTCNLDNAIEEIISDQSFWEGLTTDDDANQQSFSAQSSFKPPSSTLSSPSLNPYSVGTQPPPPPFATPPKLRPVDEILCKCTGIGVSSLRNLTMNLAQNSIFEGAGKVFAKWA